MIKRLRNFFKTVIIDAINDRQLELTAQSNLPVELVDSAGLNLDLTPESNLPVVLVDANGLELELTAGTNVPIEVIDSNGLNLDLTTDSNVPTETKKTFFTQSPDGIEKQVSTQNPFPVSDGLVCANDIWTAQSVMGDFSGEPTDLFDDLHSVISDVTATNPKELIIHFGTTIITSLIGVGAYAANGGTFSNVQIQGALSDGLFVTLVDESTDSAVKQTAAYALPANVGFNALKFIFHTANTVTISNLILPKVKVTVGRIQATSSLTGLSEDITSYRGALDVNSAWVHRKLVNEQFHQHTGTNTTPSIAVTAGDTSMTLTSVAGLAIGGELKMTEGSIQELGILVITNIVANLVTIDRPFANDYTTAAEVAEVTTNMNVVGTLAAPQIFQVDPPSGVIWQFTRLLPTITDVTAMDDGKFGGVTALTNGVTLRAITSAGRIAVFGNWKTNGDMRADMYNVDYLAKAPAGQYGLGGRWTFTASEVVAEIDGNGTPLQQLEVLIQDDLSGLTTFKMKGQGRVFSP
jgi:hypothetical protein